MIHLSFREKTGPFSERDRQAAREICDLAEPEIRSYLPDLSANIEVQLRTGGNVIPETGCGAGALVQGVVFCTVDPSWPGGIETIIRASLRSTLFHELHHLVRGWVIRGQKPHGTFIHGVICEGLATAFERDAAGGDPVWGNYPENVREWVKELMELPPNAPYRDWMFRHPDGRRWIGYRAGTYIADRAIARSQSSAAELVHTPTQEILSLAEVSD